MEEFSFLTKKQIQEIRKRDKNLFSPELSYYAGGLIHKNREFTYWTSEYDSKRPFVLDQDGKLKKGDYFEDEVGCRICLNNVYIEDLNKTPYITFHDGTQVYVHNMVSYGNDYYSFSFGRYPQKQVGFTMNEKLDAYLNADLLRKTGCSFTREEDEKSAHQILINYVKDEEYEYNGHLYVRPSFSSNYFKYENSLWVEVTPIEWIYDKKNCFLFTKDVIHGAITYDISSKILMHGKFEGSLIQRFLEEHFRKDVLQDDPFYYDEEEYNEEIVETSNSNSNPYHFDFSNGTEEEFIRGMIDSNVPLFLHGRSSDGKSARVKEIDPDCLIIYMRNATPNSLNGITVYDSSKDEAIDVPPSWYKKLVKKCEEEPDKTHILFFDELSNATPAMQGMAFNIILEHEVNGVWKLPENVRIVAAGNEMEDSLSSFGLSEPMYNRFAHLYIDTTSDDWLRWVMDSDKKMERLPYQYTSYPKKIHPAILSFVNYQHQEKKDVLRTTYTGEKPNADPRKWEMASRVLYQTNKPELISCLVGDDVTKQFVAYCKEFHITVDGVLNGEYDLSTLDLNTSQKYAASIELSLVDDENVDKVRDFVKTMSPELCKVFDSAWVGDDEHRLQKMADMRFEDEVKQREKKK
ncbi:MAG: ATP-binding protein [Bacilli bacterium]|nr:ATP-binding protein [Bacilli bacterium]